MNFSVTIRKSLYEVFRSFNLLISAWLGTFPLMAYLSKDVIG